MSATINQESFYLTENGRQSKMIFLYILFIGTLIFTIIIHEMAHFLTCKLVKCGTDCVNIGFGKPIYSFYWKNTRYNFTPILLGGYVKLEGEMEISNSPTAFVNLKYHKKVLIAIAGCVINILLGILLVYLGKLIENYVLFYIGFFNIMVGLGNLLPLPGLDGSYPILILLEKIIPKEKAIPILNKIIKWFVRILMILNIIILPWFLIKGIVLLDLVAKIYYQGVL
jgi:membrane-associated protease RseP (regulator of RpoE activity)